MVRIRRGSLVVARDRGGPAVARIARFAARRALRDRLLHAGAVQLRGGDLERPRALLERARPREALREDLEGGREDERQQHEGDDDFDEGEPTAVATSSSRSLPPSAVVGGGPSPPNQWRPSP